MNEKRSPKSLKGQPNSSSGKDNHDNVQRYVSQFGTHINKLQNNMMAKDAGKFSDKHYSQGGNEITGPTRQANKNGSDCSKNQKINHKQFMN
jgi:hypothetical protein